MKSEELYKIELAAYKPLAKIGDHLLLKQKIRVKVLENLEINLYCLLWLQQFSENISIFLVFFLLLKIPRLMLRAWYPFNAKHGMKHILMLVYQFYFLLVTMTDANSLDVLFCSWLLFACEQLQHLKQIMKPLMELSATLDTVVPNSSELFKVSMIYKWITTNNNTDNKRYKKTVNKLQIAPHNKWKTII